MVLEPGAHRPSREGVQGYGSCCPRVEQQIPSDRGGRIFLCKYSFWGLGGGALQHEARGRGCEPPSTLGSEQECGELRGC